MKFSFKWIGLSLFLLILSLIIMLAIGQVQLYFLTSVDSYEDIKVGYPFFYYSFSRDGNNFHGSNVKNLIKDYCLTLLTVVVLSFFWKVLKRKFSKK